MKPNIKKLKEAILPCLNVNLLDKHYQKLWTLENPTLGFCSVVSEVAYFILGGAKSGWVSYAVKEADATSHWWLEHKKYGRLDLTAEQFTSQGNKPPYERGLLGKPCGFMGLRVDEGNVWGFDRKPSIRAQTLLNAVLEKNKVTLENLNKWKNSFTIKSLSYKIK